MKITILKKAYFTYLPVILIVSGVVLIAVPFLPVIRDEIWYFVKQITNREIVIDPTSTAPTGGQSVFAKYLSTGTLKIQPVNKEFSLVIEKIDVNAPIVPDVSVTDEIAYKEALKNGVAHASMSPYPSSDPGNVYLFAHASVDFWELGSYATVFNLLRKLELNDRINVYYKGTRYVYSIVNKEVLPGWDTYPITRAVVEPTLTLQTCDPPGTSLNRLIITAVLSSVM